jgi:hypothetical protein
VDHYLQGKSNHIKIFHRITAPQVKCLCETGNFMKKHNFYVEYAIVLFANKNGTKIWKLKNAGMEE